MLRIEINTILSLTLLLCNPTFSKRVLQYFKWYVGFLIFNLRNSQNTQVSFALLSLSAILTYVE